jgi:hypothetical protein
LEIAKPCIDMRWRQFSRVFWALQQPCPIGLKIRGYTVVTVTPLNAVAWNSVKSRDFRIVGSMEPRGDRANEAQILRVIGAQDR